jgi:hypothetical protein
MDNNFITILFGSGVMPPKSLPVGGLTLMLLDTIFMLCYHVFEKKGWAGSIAFNDVKSQSEAHP